MDIVSMKMRTSGKVMIMFVISILYGMEMLTQEANGERHAVGRQMIEQVPNATGPYLGLVIPNQFEMDPLLQSPSFISSNLTLDIAGRRFRFGKINGKEVIVVKSGLGMVNAGVTTQLLLSLFDIEGVVHYGISRNANPTLHTGDVTIPMYWSHSGLWNWQRFGDGPETELALEVNGDFTRQLGYLRFENFTTNNVTGCSPTNQNLLNNVWYQPEEIFPVDGNPEEKQHAFWIPVGTDYFQISKSLEGLALEDCINITTCLSEPPKVTTVLRGTSASIYLDNAAYRSFLYAKFEVSPADTESAAVALICCQQRLPFIIFRALTDLAGGDDALLDVQPAAIFTELSVNNTVKAVLAFINSLEA